MIATPAHNELSIASPVKGIYILRMPYKLDLDFSVHDIPDPDDAVFGPGGEVDAVRRETDGPDVEVVLLRHGFIHQGAGC